MSVDKDNDRAKLDEATEHQRASAKRADAAMEEMNRLGELVERSRLADDDRRAADDIRRGADDDRRGADDQRRAADDVRRGNDPVDLTSETDPKDDNPPA